MKVLQPKLLQKAGQIADTNDARRPFQGGDVALKHFEVIQKHRNKPYQSIKKGFMSLFYLKHHHSVDHSSATFNRIAKNHQLGIR